MKVLYFRLLGYETVQSDFQYLRRTRCFKIRCIACKTSKPMKSKNTVFEWQERKIYGLKIHVTNKITDDVNTFSYSKCKVYLRRIRLENNLPNLQQKHGNSKHIILQSLRKGIILKAVWNDGQCKYVIKTCILLTKLLNKVERRRNEVMNLTGKATCCMKINTVNKLDRSLILRMPVETTGGQISENILQEWIRTVQPSSLVYSKREWTV